MDGGVAAFGGGLYTCGECRKVSRDRLRLLRHYLSEHTDAARKVNGFYACSRCNQYPTQARKYLVIRHYVSVHTDEIPYHCTQCNRDFRHRSCLLAHYNSKLHQPKIEASQIRGNSPETADWNLTAISDEPSANLHRLDGVRTLSQTSTNPVSAAADCDDASRSKEDLPQQFPNLAATRDSPSATLPQFDEIQAENESSTDPFSDSSNWQEIARTREDFRQSQVHPSFENQTLHGRTRGCSRALRRRSSSRAQKESGSHNARTEVPQDVGDPLLAADQEPSSHWEGISGSEGDLQRENSNITYDGDEWHAMPPWRHDNRAGNQSCLSPCGEQAEQPAEPSNAEMLWPLSLFDPAAEFDMVDWDDYLSADDVLILSK